jgi:hypothetical protein
LPIHPDKDFVEVPPVTGFMGANASLLVNVRLIVVSLQYTIITQRKDQGILAIAFDHEGIAAPTFCLEMQDDAGIGYAKSAGSRNGSTGEMARVPRGAVRTSDR